MRLVACVHTPGGVRLRVLQPGLHRQMDLLFAVCTNQPNAAALLIEAYLTSTNSYDERLEYVRCWSAIEGSGGLPKVSSCFQRSPKVGDHGPLTQWLVWAETDDGWACAAAHAHAAARVVDRFEFNTVKPYPYRQQLARFLRSYATVATLAKSGQRYLDGVVRLACPGYRTALSSTSTFLHASALIPDVINSVMSPCVHRTVRRQYEDVNWSACTPQQFMLAASILADATGAAPLHFNGDLCAYKRESGPTLFVAHDFDIGTGDTVAVVIDEVMYRANGSYLDVIGAFLEAMPDAGIHAALARTAPAPARLAAHLI